MSNPYRPTGAVRGVLTRQHAERAARAEAAKEKAKAIILAHIARAFGVSPEEAERRLKAAE
jgi:hypothetical protein